MSKWGDPWSEEAVTDYYRRTGRPKRGVEIVVRGVPAPHILGRGTRVEIDGYKFPSLAESRRYQELKLLQAAGEIKDLEVHPFWPIKVRGVEICNVWLDFSYRDARGKLVVEDVKAERRGKDGKVKFTTDTRISKIGRRLLKAVYGIDVSVIKGGRS